MSLSEKFVSQPQTMQRYYRWHAAIYDATRWLFLFGRHRLLGLLPQKETLTLAEIGCGTGFNLKYLARRHPNWQLIGLDVSRHMLDKAFRILKPYIQRVFLIERAYGKGLGHLRQPVDAIIFSYSLTMFNPGYEGAIEQAAQDLRPGGLIAVVDFYDASARWFRHWMSLNHVRMEGHLLPVLQQHFDTQTCEVRSAYAGLWRYFLFVGVKKQTPAAS